MAKGRLNLIDPQGKVFDVYEFCGDANLDRKERSKRFKVFLGNQINNLKRVECIIVITYMYVTHRNIFDLVQNIKRAQLCSLSVSTISILSNDLSFSFALSLFPIWGLYSCLASMKIDRLDSLHWKDNVLKSFVLESF